MVGSLVARDLLDITHPACPPRWTVALKGGPLGQAPAPILAGTVLAPVDHGLAASPLEARLAVALGVARVGVLATGPAIEADVVVTSRHPGLAVGSGEPGRAPARKVVDPIDARSSVQAGAGRAVLVVGLAIGAREALPAVAGVRVDVVLDEVATCNT